jgi:signal transduction histidine kinase/CheY-like chemotaxis protein
VQVEGSGTGSAGAVGTRLALVLVAGACLLVGVTTVLFTLREIGLMREQHEQILSSRAEEAAREIRLYVESRQQLVETFAVEKRELLDRFAQDPENEELRALIIESLARWFRNYFTFTLADGDGNDIVDDIEGFVGEICQIGIRDYVAMIEGGNFRQTFRTVIHPQPGNYHFDVMAPRFSGSDLAGVFFVSFHPDDLAGILSSHQSPGHRLALVQKNLDYLIEVTPEGARDAIGGRRSINFTAEEIAEIRAEVPVEGSLWTLVGYLESGLLSRMQRESWTNAVIILLTVAFAGFVSFRKIQQLGRSQEEAFAQLQETNDSLREMAEEQKALREAAESGERSKAQFLAAMSHEIRTPLNAVIGLTDIVLKSTLTGQQRMQLSRVSQAAGNLLTLINDILDFSKIEAGHMKIDDIAYSVRDVLDEVLSVVQPRAEENSNSIRILVSPDIPAYLLGDPMRVGQVLTNLAGNAAKFTRDGEISLAVRRHPNTDGDWLEFSVKDTGIGMTADQVSTLFRPFVQADQSVTRTFGGTGLGLSISRELVEAMGGRIEVESRPDAGSEFRFFLPYRPAENAPAEAGKTGDITGIQTADPVAPASGKTPTDFSGLRILLVEDNELNRMVAVGVLEPTGCEVAIATDGQQALDMLRKQGEDHFSLVLMDVQMPVMDGLTATRAIRQELGFSRLPIIAMTANVLPEERRNCLDAGMNDHLTKPFKAEDLHARIGRLAEDARPDASTKPAATTDGGPADRSTTAFDFDRTMEELGLPETVVRQLALRFSAEYETAPDRFRDLFTEGRFEEAMRLAHSIKGASASLRMEAVSVTAAALESRLRDGDTNRIPEAELDAFAREIDRTVTAIGEAIGPDGA